jgi:hypothetical protein
VDGREADGAGDAAAVEFERTDIGDVERVEIHSHAVEHGLHGLRLGNRPRHNLPKEGGKTKRAARRRPVMPI